MWWFACAAARGADCCPKKVGGRLFLPPGLNLGAAFQKPLRWSLWRFAKAKSESSKQF